MTDTGTDILRRQAASLPDELQPVFSNWLERFESAALSLPASLSAEADACRLLPSVVASSEFAGAVLLRDWDWFSRVASQGVLGPPSAENDAENDASAEMALRKRRNRGLLRIHWRSVAGVDDAWATLGRLSSLADSLIAAAHEQARSAMPERIGRPLDRNGDEIPLIILAMGKLGGSELNFSSDVDLIFLYAEDGDTDGPRSLTGHEYFVRLSQRIVRLLDDVTDDGFVYRVDTRLRPFGDSGPPAMSFPAFENYLLQHGRGWERYAYVKARPVGASADTQTARELLTGVIEPFVYRRYLDYGVFESLREMKAMIETEVQKRELSDNIKLGPGGIREIEFIAQSMQLVRGGADRSLRCRDLRTALARVAHDRGVGRDAQQSLTDAYVFLRRFENGLQAIRDQQTHDIPVHPTDRARLALVMGYDSWTALSSDLDGIRRSVVTHFEKIAFRRPGGDATAIAGDGLAALWRSSTSAREWTRWLRDEGIRDPEQVAEAVTDFARSPTLRQADAVAQRRLDRFVYTLLAELRHRPRRGVATRRVLALISQVARRSAYVALLNENPLVLERLIDLCEQSAYLASEIEKYPALLDELLDPRLYTEHISASGMREELALALQPLDAEDVESKIEMLARFQRTALFRIAVADVSGNLPIMKVSDRLTDLAEIVLHTALDIAWNELTRKHGRPGCRREGSYYPAGFGVIAYGKLGGMELSYGSDLDLVFLHDSAGTDQHTNGDKRIDNNVFFARLVRRLVHFLTTQTSSGALYEVDTRLRPSGQSGLLVVSIEGFEKYQEDNAWTWEHQALLRSRPIAGSPSVLRSFDRIRTETLRRRVHRDKLKSDVISMRDKMREQLDKSTESTFDLKQGEGGIGDIEFLVQYLVLENAANERALVFYSDNIRQLGALAATGLLPADDVMQLQQIYRDFRLRSHRLALDDKPAVVDSAAFEAERRFVRNAWRRVMAG